MLIDLAGVEEIPENGSKSYQVGKSRVLIVRTRSGWFALDDRCPHQERTLEGCLVKEKSVECPWHSVEIELGTGKILYAMGFLDLPPVVCFPIREEQGRLLVEVAQ